MNLAEGRDWWASSGARQLGHLLRKNWDVVRDQPAVATDEFLLTVAQRLREGERFGRKWATRDRRVAEKIVVWYVETTK